MRQRRMPSIYLYSYMMILVLLSCSNSIWAQTGGGKAIGKKSFYSELSALDSIANLSSADQLYRSKDDAKQKISSMVDQEYFFLTDSSVSKSVQPYHYYCAKKYGNKIQCIKNFRKKDLLKRWVIKPIYKTIWDTIFEERKCLAGINFGGDNKPVGTIKPIEWHTKYCYDSCSISLKGSSNMDGEDNFLLYTFNKTRKDTICNVRLARSLDPGSPIYNRKRDCPFCSRVYIKIYNKTNVNFSPGACSAFLVVRPQYPKVIAKQKVRFFKISRIT